VGIGHGIATGQSMFATLNVDKGSAGEALRIGTGANDQSISFGGKAGITTSGNAVNMILNANGQANQLVLAGSGNVGVGTASPSAKFTVDIGRTTNNAYDGVLIAGTQANNIGGGNNFALHVAGAFSGTTTDRTSQIYVSNPNVSGINQSVRGITVDKVSGGNYGSAAVFMSDDSRGGDFNTINGNYALYSANANSSYFAGNVGIGTAAPTNMLSLYSSTANPGIDLQKSTGNRWRIYTDNGFAIRDESNATDLLRLRQGGGTTLYGSFGVPIITIPNSSTNVGIGTTTPAFKLDVAGDINTSGNLHAAGNVYAANVKQYALSRTLPSTVGDTVEIGSFGVANSGHALDVAVTVSEVGYLALLSATTASGNTAVGEEALTGTTTGSNNVAVGMRALQANTTGANNAALGHLAMYFNTSGSSNLAVGTQALYTNTTGNFNTASGYQAIYSNTTGNSNTAMGYQSLFNATTGGTNTALGIYALMDLTTGFDNTAIGTNTGRGIITGQQNTIIGANVTGLAAGLSNNIIIADGAGNRRINVDASGNVGLGTTTPQGKLDVTGTATDKVLLNLGGGSLPTLSPGLNVWTNGVGTNTVAIGTTTPGYKLEVAGTVGGTVFTSTSDIRFKRDIAPLKGSLARIELLRGVSYRWRKDEFPNRGFDDKAQLGFIAQELEQVLPELVSMGADGFKSVAYTGVIPVVVEAVKELHTLIGPLLPFAQVADKLQLSKDTLTLEIKAPVKIGGDLLVAGDVTAVSLKVKKVVADEVQAGKLQAGSVQSGNLQATRVTTGELGMVLDGGAQQDLLDLPLQASYTVVVSGPDGSFVHATVLNTGGLIQITAKHLNGLDLLATGTRLRVINTSVQSKRLNASWTRVG